MSSSPAAAVEKPMVPTEIQALMNQCFESVLTKRDDSEVLLNKAFQALSKGLDKAQVSPHDLVTAINHVGLSLTLEEVKETMKLISKQELFNCDEFINIVKLLVNLIVVASHILRRRDEKMIVLHGQPGVGKTWTAQKIAGHVTRKGDFDVAIWVYLNRIYEGLSLHESIAYQLSVLTAFEKSEAEEAKKKQEVEKEKGKQEEPEEAKEKRKRARIEQMIQAKLQQKKLLLVLDNEGSKMKLDENKKLCLKLDGQRDFIDLGAILALKEGQYFKVLITSTNPPTHLESIGLMLRPLSLDESRSMVFQQMDGVVNPDEIKKLAEFFISKSERLPAEILFIARVVSSFGRSVSGMKKLLEDKAMLEKEKSSKLRDILIRGYERLPKSVLIDCYSSETTDTHFLRRGGMVNFNELITYWIIEEHLGQFDRIEDAYEEGHRVLMELMHCGLLEKQEGDYVSPSGAKLFKFDIHDRNEYYRKIHRGLGVTYDMKLGRVAWANGMIKTVSTSGQEVQKPSTLFVDGNYIGEKPPVDILFRSSTELKSLTSQEGKKESTALMLDNYKKLPTADSLFESLNELENLVVFSPTGQHFQRPVGMKKLRLLVLRDCQYLNSLNPYFELSNDKKNPPKELRRTKSEPPLSQIQSHNPHPSPSPVVFHYPETLTVLEISGPSLWSEIPESLFEKMSNLKTLNMSHLPIKKLPQSFVKLTKVEFLILRGCPSFEELDTLTNFKDLQTIDLSGSTSFEKFHDKSLRENKKLQILNLSETMIKTLPLINSNPELKFISLKDCTDLERIRQIGNLKSIQIFDISGATQVEEFRDPSLEKLQGLVILDVSRTAIRRLPANICNPRYLYVQGCPHLKRLPPVEDFTKVEVIDLSGSSHLEEIRKEFFSNMKCLRELNLSKTSVKHLPFLSSLGCLRRLLLVECQHLEKLKGLSALEELEFLDLSGCKDLMKVDDDSFDRMSCLQYLNVSGVKLDRLPSLSKLMKLEELYVRDCPNIKELIGVEQLPALNILDYSGTILKPTPSNFKNPHPPRVLGVDIDSFDHQEMLTKLGATSAESHEYESTDQQNVDFRQKDLRQCKWSISAVVDQKLGSSVHGTHFLQLLKKHPSLLSKNLSQFHLLVHPTEKKASLVANSALYASEVALRDIYFKQVSGKKMERCLDNVSEKKMERCLEIREFDNVPPFLGYLLKQAQFVVLIDNEFFKSLLDLGVDNIMDTKACWIERCDQLEHVATSEKEEDTKKPEETTKSKDDQPQEPAKSKGDHTGESAETEGEPAKSKGDQMGDSAKSEGDQSGELAKSEGEPAKSKGDQTGESPKSEGEPAKGSGDQTGELTKSKGEPAESKGDQTGESTKREGEPAKGRGDQIGELTKSEGEPDKSKGDQTGESTKSEGEPAKSKGDQTGESTKSEGEPAKSKGEQTGESAKSEGKTREPAKSKDVPGEPAKSKDEPTNSQGEPVELAKSKGDTEKNFVDILDKLEILWISDGLNLRGIFNGDISFKNLKSLYLEYCPQISIICSSSLQLQSLEILYVKYCQKLETLFTDDTAQLKKLTELHLWGLQDLKRIDHVPSLHTLRVGECPLLEHIISASTQGHDHQEFEGHPNLKTLHIKSCDKLKTICESSQDDASLFQKLWELELSGLPELKEIAFPASPFLQNLRVSECPTLQHIFCSSNNHGDFRNVEVKYCDELKTVFGVGGIDLSKVEKMELISLPEVDNVNRGELPVMSCQMGTTLTEVDNEKCMIWGCPKL